MKNFLLSTYAKQSQQVMAVAPMMVSKLIFLLSLLKLLT